MIRLLTALDDLLLPPLSAALERAVAAADRIRRLPAGVLPTRPWRRYRDWGDRLDRQAAARVRGMGALVAAPQLAVAVVGVVIVAGVVAATQVRPAQRRAAGGTLAGPPALACGLAAAAQGSGFVGPASGTPVAAYVATRRALLDRCAAHDPALADLAVVSLRAEVGPAALPGLLRTGVLLRIYLATAGRPLLFADTSPAVGATTRLAALAAMRATAYQLRTDALLRRGEASDAPSAASGAVALALARAELAQAARLAGGCACEYAVVIEATLRQLAALSAVPSVRLVDLAPVGATLPAATLVPLPPAGRDPGAGAPEPFVAGEPQAGGPLRVAR